MVRERCPFHEVAEEATRLLRSCRRAEAGPHAVSRIGRERELRYEEQPAADSAQVEIHTACRVRKDAIPEQALKEPVRVAQLIGAPDAHERDDAMLDRPDMARIHTHIGAADPLDESDHDGLLWHLRA
jgi:hypothetical protein